MIEICNGGLLSTLQDCGRHGLRRFGIPWSGSTAADWLQIANALVGNATDAVALECYEGGLAFQTDDKAARIAVVGDADVRLTTAGGSQPLCCWRSYTIPPHSEVTLRSTGRVRLALIALEKLEVAAVLGSRSTYSKAKLGGINGNELRKGDQLHAGLPTPVAEQACKAFGLPFAEDGTQQAARVRAVPGPQHDAFTSTAQQLFFSACYRLSSDVDRMGARFEGPVLDHLDAEHRDIVSDATLPGSVQIPGSGQPIVLLADSQTIGGYPKIATVVSVDLQQLALYRPGKKVQFTLVNADEAINIARASHQHLLRHLNSITPISEAQIDNDALFSENLIDGVVNASLPN